MLRITKQKPFMEIDGKMIDFKNDFPIFVIGETYNLRSKTPIRKKPTEDPTEDPTKEVDTPKIGRKIATRKEENTPKRMQIKFPTQNYV